MPKDYLQLLEILKAGIAYDSFEKEFNPPSEHASFVNEALRAGHIQISKASTTGSTIKLTPAGLSYLKKESQTMGKWYRKPEWWGIIVSGLIGAAGLAVAMFRP